SSDVCSSDLDVAVADMEHVEEEGPDSAPLHHLGAESPGGLLETSRPPVLVEVQRFTVEDEVVAVEAPHEITDLGKAVAHPVEVAGVDLDPFSLPMDLDPDPVELPLDRCVADPADGLREILCCLGEHRFDRPEQGEPDCGERLLPSS